MRTIFFGLFVTLLFTACNEQRNHQGKTPLVEVEGSFLYREDVQSVIPASLSNEDSLQFAEHYIHKWIEDILLYQKAKRNIPDNEKINMLVENYRKALIMHTYQQELIRQQLSGEISEAELKGYYDQHLDLFKVERPLLKGLFIKVPLKAPEIANVRRWYKTVGQEAVEHLEKYAMRHAVKYEYFYDKWVPVADVTALMPLDVADADAYFAKNKQVELKDTAYYYFLNVSDYCPAGGQEPFESARGQAKELLLNTKQVQFMKQVKADLFRRAEKNEKIKYY